MVETNSFLHKVATYFTDETKLQETCFVFPNRRAGLFFRKHVAQLYQTPIFAPTILTIDECFHELCHLQIEPFLPLIFRLYTIYEKLFRTNEPIDRFLYWGKLLLQDFSEIDNHLIKNVKDLFTNVEDINNINEQYDYLNENQKKAIYEFWGVVIQSKNNFSNNIKENVPLDNFLNLWSKLYILYQTFKQDLLAENKAYEGMLHRYVIENWESIGEEKKRKHYAFIAFNALTKSEEELLLRLQQENKATFFFDYTKKLLCDPANKASLFRQHNIDIFGNNMPIKEKEEISLPTITTHLTTSTIAQIHEMYDILIQLYPPNDNNRNFIKTAIILPEESMLIPVLHALPEHIDKINVTMGFPLKATLAYSFIKNIQNLHDKKKEEVFYYKNVLAILSHPFVQAKDKNDITRIIKYIKENNITYISHKIFTEIADLTEIFTPPDNDAFATIQYIRKIVLTFVCGHDGVKDLVLTQLNLLEEKIKIYPCIHSTKDVFTLLITLLDTLSVPYVGEPLEGLQIMGVLESRALDFENVIFLGFNDDTYPGKLFSHSFIPMSLRKGFGLPTPERQDAIFAYNFYKLILYTKNLHLVYSNTTNEKTTAEPSRYLWQLALQYNIPINKINIVPKNQQTFLNDTATIQKTDEDLIIITKMTEEGISPTWIKNYIKCPLYFYWTHIKNLSESQDVNDLATPLQIGTIFHNIMYHLYHPLIGQNLTMSVLENVQKYFCEQWNSPNKEIQTILKPIEEQQLVKNVLFNYIFQQVENDKNNAPFTILSLEEEYKDTLKLDNGQQIILKGKIDRIDRLNNTIRLIDYKTSNVELKIQTIDDLFIIDDPNTNINAFQVIFYCLLYNSHTHLPLYPHLYSIKQQFAERKKNTTQIIIEQDEFDFNKISPVFVMHLKEIIESLLDKNTPFEASLIKDSCATCKFYNLCHNLS